MTLKLQSEFTPQLNTERLNLGDSAPLISPLVIYIEPSSYCNLKCNFCPQYLEPEKINKQNMTFEVFKKTINQISEFPNELQKLRICGTGDPTFNKQLPEMLDYASSKKNFRQFEMITNGLLINDRLLESIANNLTRLIISIEGLNDEDYYLVTNKKIKFFPFYEKIKKIYKNRKNCKLHIKIHNNAVKTKELKNRFFDLFQNYCDQIYIENLVDLWPETDASYVTTEKHRFIDKKESNNKVCSQIFKTMQINSDGSVIPCSIDWQAKNKIGDINKDNLLEIWKSQKLKEFRIRHLKGERFSFLPCKECKFNSVSDIDNVDSYANEILMRL